MRAFATLVAALALGGCGGSDEPASESPPPELSVEQAVDYEGAARVRGNLVLVSGEPRLCTAVLESFPPQCGQPSLALEGDLEQLEGVENGEQVTVQGEIEDGTMFLAS